ncbi:hypothetical protein QUB52_29470, partial [Microcoleus sp. A6-C6]|uniref:hypothetical protein n=1 Tax=Microcoleus sp. A6-C6 TaxID=2818548 RepID=UPI002FD36446
MNNYTQSAINNNNASTYALGLNNPREIAIDAVGHRLFLVDALNNRVLIYNLDSNNHLIDKTPDFVLGQSNFTTNTSEASNSKFSAGGARWLAYDQANNRLFVCDIIYNRVLVFDVASITNGEIAVNVLGQPDFATVSEGTSSTKLYNPAGIDYDPVGNRLFVAEDNNHRVVVFDTALITNGEAAVNVLGQANFISNVIAPVSAASIDTPTDLLYDSVNKRLYVSDEVTNRILVFDLTTITNGESAVSVLGQINFANSGAATTQAGLSGPRAMTLNPCSQRLFVADNGNRRIMVFDVATVTIGEGAVNVLGQANFTTNTAATTQTGSTGSDCYFDVTTGKLYVSNGTNNRVLIFGLDTSAVVTHATCNSSGAINITAAGGNAPYTYNWGGGITTEDRTNLIGGIYTVTVTDNCGAKNTVAFTVAGPTSSTDTDSDGLYDE